MDKYLDGITAQIYSEPIDYLADANEELEITLLIAQLSDQSASNSRNVYLSLVAR